MPLYCFDVEPLLSHGAKNTFLDKLTRNMAVTGTMKSIHTIPVLFISLFVSIKKKGKFMIQYMRHAN